MLLDLLLLGITKTAEYPSGFFGFSLGPSTSSFHSEPSDLMDYPQASFFQTDFQTKGLRASFAYSVWITGMPAYSLGFLYLKEKLSFFGGCSGLSSSLSLFSESGEAAGSMIYSFGKFGLGGALRMGKFSFGFSYLRISENIDGDAASSSAFSFGALFSGKKLRFSAGAFDLSSESGGPYISISYVSPSGVNLSSAFSSRKTVGKSLSFAVGKSVDLNRGVLVFLARKDFYLDYSDLSFLYNSNLAVVFRGSGFNLGYAMSFKGELGLAHRLFLSI